MRHRNRVLKELQELHRLTLTAEHARRIARRIAFGLQLAQVGPGGLVNAKRTS